MAHSPDLKTQMQCDVPDQWAWLFGSDACPAGELKKDFISQNDETRAQLSVREAEKHTDVERHHAHTSRTETKTRKPQGRAEPARLPSTIPKPHTVKRLF